jgi:hypothetical protein
MSSTANVEKIRKQNDTFRRTGAGGQCMITSGVLELADLEGAFAIQQKVACYDSFTKDVESRWCALPHC